MNGTKGSHHLDADYYEQKIKLKLGKIIRSLSISKKYRNGSLEVMKKFESKIKLILILALDGNGLTLHEWYILRG